MIRLTLIDFTLFGEVNHCSAKPKIPSPRRGYLKRLLHYSSASQILADFGDNLTKFKHASIRPVYFRVSLSYFPVWLLNDTMI